MMTRISYRLAFLPLFLALAASAAGAAAKSASASKPNIVVILADDCGYGSAGCYGADGRLVRTPNIDFD